MRKYIEGQEINIIFAAGGILIFGLLFFIGNKMNEADKKFFDGVTEAATTTAYRQGYSDAFNAALECSLEEELRGYRSFDCIDWHLSRQYEIFKHYDNE